MLSILLALSALAAHPNSLSSSLVEVEGAAAHLRLRVQVASLLEVVEGLDADADGTVTAAEVADARGPILAYAARHYRMWTGTERDLTGGRELVAEPRAVRLLAPEPLPPPYRDQVEVELVYRADRAIEDLLLEVTLFWTTSPGHIDYATVAWPDGATRSFALYRGAGRARFDPAGRGVWRAFFVQGWRHILGGLDHLAFLVALVLAARRLRSLLGVVTAFTVAHSISLALATLGLVDVSAHAALVEQAIALSIAYVATETALRPDGERARWIEAFVFGLLHGLGFAGFLSRSLVLEPSRTAALVSFNLGVEAGQVLVVALLAAALRVVPSREAGERRFLAPRLLRRLGSAAVALLGLAWFVQRV